MTQPLILAAVERGAAERMLDLHIFETDAGIRVAGKDDDVDA